MAKWIFALLAASIVLILPQHDARAQPIPVTVDGCAKLARVIYDEVSSAAFYGPGNAGPWLIDIGQGDISVCTHAAQTVSRAFSSALKSAGITVKFEGYGQDMGDFCLSAFLSQCYPSRYPLESASIGVDSAMISQSWTIVSRAVMREMYNPISSDEVRFRDNDLKLRLGLSLRSVNRPQLPSLQSHSGLPRNLFQAP
jgi:hypothetical protein